MISLPLAKELKEAGLVWQASVNDYFAIPERDMDERVFVISDLLANLNIFRGWPVVTFHGTAEWALDYILTTEVVWLPREDQLRELLLTGLADEETASETASMPVSLTLSYERNSCRCAVHLGEFRYEAQGESAEEAYGRVLLALLEQQAAEASTS